MADVLKSVDKSICALLQNNARTPLSALAEQIGLSVPSISEHVRKMEEQGIIQEYSTRLNPRALGFDITAFIFVEVESSNVYNDFIQQCREMPQVQECHAITGSASHLLKIRVENTASLEQLLARLQQINGVKRTTTNLALSTHIETIALPLNLEKTTTKT